MSADQAQFIQLMKKDWLYEDGGASVTAVNAAVRVMKLIQACTGSVKRDDGTVLELDCNARMREVVDIINETDGKVLIFIPYIASMKRLAAYLRKHFKNPDYVACISGATSTGKRQEIVAKFQDEASELRVIIAHPETAAHGITLTAANAIIWYAPYPKAEYYIQGNERTNRPGQKRNQTVYNLSGGPIEDKVYDSVSGKIGEQLDILKLYEQMTRARTKPTEAIAA
jgi:SNF2 family DNA or RNA helicase